MIAISTKIAIIGAGSGGQTAAADLTLKGYKVWLYEFPEMVSSVEKIMQDGVIRLVENDSVSHEVRIAGISTDFRQVVRGADIILVMVPSFVVEKVAHLCLDYLDSGRKIYFLPGGVGGALEFLNLVRASSKKFIVGESSTLPYATRLTSPGVVSLMLRVKTLFFAAFPGKESASLGRELKELYTSVEILQDVLETSLNNGNPITHPGPSILNTAVLERGTPGFGLYKDGITPAVAHLNEVIDTERIYLCRELGYKPISACERLYRMGYSPQTNNLYEAYSESPVFCRIEGPDSLNHRYVVEDVGYGLVPIASISRVLNLDVPTMEAMITLASVLLQTDIRTTGRTAQKMGLKGMSRNAIRNFLWEGSK